MYEAFLGLFYSLVLPKLNNKYISFKLHTYFLLIVNITLELFKIIFKGKVSRGHISRVVLENFTNQITCRGQFWSQWWYCKFWVELTEVLNFLEIGFLAIFNKNKGLQSFEPQKEKLSGFWTSLILAVIKFYH